MQEQMSRPDMSSPRFSFPGSERRSLSCRRTESSINTHGRLRRSQTSEGGGSERVCVFVIDAAGAAGGQTRPSLANQPAASTASLSGCQVTRAPGLAVPRKQREYAVIFSMQPLKTHACIHEHSIRRFNACCSPIFTNFIPV